MNLNSIHAEQLIPWNMANWCLIIAFVDNTNLATILQFLSDAYYYETTWYNLGLQLGIHDPTLKRIKNDVGGDTQTCLRECLSAWLRQEDSVKEKGSPRWFTLARALDAIGERRIATIAYEKDLTLK